jgi:hypothetical protein
VQSARIPSRHPLRWEPVRPSAAIPTVPEHPLFSFVAPWSAKDPGAVTMIETDTMLVNCPRCGAWPMAASLPKPSSANRQLPFRCVKWSDQERSRLCRARDAQRLPWHPAPMIGTHHEML